MTREDIIRMAREAGFDVLLPSKEILGRGGICTGSVSEGDSTVVQKVVIGDATLYLADCMEVLRTLPDNSIDAVVTDPPYGLSFMGKRWDYDVPSVDVWAECLRVLKPGGHLLAFAGTRTQHRMAVRIEDAGFEIRDMIAWVYSTGFPKSLDVSKAIDKAAGRIGNTTESIKAILRDAHIKSGKTLEQLNKACGFEASGYLRSSSSWAFVLPPSDKWPVIRDALSLSSDMDSLFAEAEREVIGFQKRGKSVNTDFMSGGNDITAPATDAARQWQGWGTALKPALEPITVARKPLVGTVAENVLAHGTGAINVDGCRVATDGAPRARGGLSGVHDESDVLGNGGLKKRVDRPDDATGRWPANLIHDGSEEVLALAGEQARFFYCAKASKRDRDEGLEGFEQIKVKTKSGGGAPNKGRTASSDGGVRANIHPTVKPTDLMRYLCRLVTPPGGVVLDPFMGSGSTGKAALLAGFRFIGIEREAEYFDIACERIQKAVNQGQLFTEPVNKPEQGSLLTDMTLSKVKK